MTALIHCMFLDMENIHHKSLQLRTGKKKQLLSDFYNAHLPNHILSCAVVPLQDKTFRAETRVPSPPDSAIHLKILLYCYFQLYKN